MDEENGAAPKRKRGRPPKAKQTDLPGVEGPGIAPKRIKSIELLADDYVGKRNDRQEATTLEVEAKNKLIDALHRNADAIGKNPDDGTIRYEYDGGEKSRRVIVLKPTDEKLQVKDVEAFEEVNVG